MHARFLILVATALAPFGQAVEDLGSWSYSRTVSVNVTDLGLSDHVTGFPLLVRLNAGNFDFAAAQSGGQDVRFTRDDGVSRLPHEIERWDAANRVAEIWVLADTVRKDGSSAFRMYFGNDSAPDSSGGGAVFAAANGFKAVWHLGNEPGNRPNSVAGGHEAVPNYAASFWPGVIAGADSLRGGSGPPSDSGGTRDYLDIGDGYADFTGGFTYSVWIYPTAVRSWSRLLDLSNGSAGGTDVTVFRRGSTDSLQFRCLCPNVAGPAAGRIVLNEWQHFTVVRQPGSSGAVGIYRNGARLAASASTGTMASAIQNVNRTRNYIGRSNNFATSDNEYYQGKIDEPRLSGVPRSADWIRLSYETQKPGTALVALGQPAQGFRLGGPPDDREGTAWTNEARAHYRDGMTFSEEDAPEETRHRTVVSASAIRLDREKSSSSDFDIRIEADIREGALSLSSYDDSLGGNRVHLTLVMPQMVLTPAVETGTVTADKLIATQVVTTPKWEVVPDFVFDPDYQAKSLAEVEAFVRAHRHLPHVPSARRIADQGLDLTEMNLQLLKTVEELTLHVIELDKRHRRVEDAMQSLQSPGREE